MHIALLKATTLFYLVGSLLYLYFFFTLNERSARIGRMFLLGGVIVHGVAFVARYFAAGYTPITSLFESLTFFAFAIVSVFLAFELRYNLRVQGAFVAPLAFAFSHLGEQTHYFGDLSGTLSGLADAAFNPETGWAFNEQSLQKMPDRLAEILAPTALGAGIDYVSGKGNRAAYEKGAAKRNPRVLAVAGEDYEGTDGGIRRRLAGRIAARGAFAGGIVARYQ